MGRLKLPLIVFAVIATLSALVSRWTGLGFWATAAILVAAWFVNGLVAVIEDDVPGGFNNPDGTSTPSYVVVLKWVGRGIMGIAIVAFIALVGIIVRDHIQQGGSTQPQAVRHQWQLSAGTGKDSDDDSL